MILLTGQTAANIRKKPRNSTDLDCFSSNPYYITIRQIVDISLSWSHDKQLWWIYHSQSLSFSAGEKHPWKLPFTVKTGGFSVFENEVIVGIRWSVSCISETCYHRALSSFQNRISKNSSIEWGIISGNHLSMKRGPDDWLAFCAAIKELQPRTLQRITTHDDHNKY